jgi:Tfp pilus assembly pilus retraction ATPase PilT
MVRAPLSESLVSVIRRTLLHKEPRGRPPAAHEIMIGFPAVETDPRGKGAQMYSTIQTLVIGHVDARPVPVDLFAAT